MQPRKVFILISFGCLLVFSAIAILRAMKKANAEAFAHQGDTTKSLPVLWPAPPFTYVNENGQTVTLESLKGTVWITNFIFTTCRTVCPLLTAKIVQAQRLLTGVRIRFVSFSVDPSHDTPEVLKAYQRQWALDESRWTLLSTDDATLQETMRGFKVTAMPSPGKVDPIIHSAVFILVDAEGFVRGVYSSEDRSDFQAMLKAAKRLAGQETREPPPLIADGATMYHQLSCAGCHEKPTLAPHLGGRSDKRQTLATGQFAIFDEAYVKESIIAPQAKMLRGYTLKMPSYDGLLNEAQLNVLVDYILAMPAAQVEGEVHAEEAPLAVDPVCNMQVRTTGNAITTDFDGGTYYFCSQFCKERFTATPHAPPVDENHMQLPR